MASATRTAPILSTEQAESFRRDGAVLVKGALSSRELDWLETGLEEAHAQPSAMFSRYTGSGGVGETVVDQFPSERSPALARLIAEAPLAQMAAEAMGTPSAQLILEQMFYKDAGQIVPTPWHQDTPFLRFRGHEMARVWLTCDPSPAGVTLEIVRGSHLWNVVYDTGGAAPSGIEKGEEGDAFTYEGIGDDRLPPVPDIAAQRDSFDILSWDVEPGDAVIFHGNLLHGTSGRANHPHKRRAFTSMWGGPNLRYQASMAHGMPLPRGGDASAVPQGAAIGDYPQLFPVLWRA